MPVPLPCVVVASVLIAHLMSTPHSRAAAPFELTLREHGETTHSWSEAEWDPAKTAIIVCDFWDSHHSVTAVRRVNEMAPRLNAVLGEARSRGATIIHSPSDCMPAYEDHPARKAALAAPKSEDSPPDIAAWCHRIPSEEAAAYPIDQSDGGEDESKWENDQWAARLEADGRNPGTPWLKQNAGLEIAKSDFIAAEGDVVWNVLKSRDIEHVILTGVHTNMCVLGRPFGLRNMVRGGFDTVLMRDMTDVMYNPARWPYVSHFTGLDLVVQHIERFVCPTITSDQLIGGEPFRFRGDSRPTVVTALPLDHPDYIRRWTEVRRRYLDADFRVVMVDLKTEHGSHLIDEADLLILGFPSEITPKTEERLRAHVAASKPIIGIGSPPENWANVFGVSREGLKAIPDFTLTADPEADTTLDTPKLNPPPADDALLDLPNDGEPADGKERKYYWQRNTGLSEKELSHPLSTENLVLEWGGARGTLVEGTHRIAMGRLHGRSLTLAAWSYTRPDGGRSYCQVGIGGYNAKARPLLHRAVHWSLDLPLPAGQPEDPGERQTAEGWKKVSHWKRDTRHRDFRTLLQAPPDFEKSELLLVCKSEGTAQPFLNGEELAPADAKNSWKIAADAIDADTLNLLVVRTDADGWPNIHIAEGDKSWKLDASRMQEHYTDDPEPDVSFPIPPQFGAPTDLIQSWPAGE